MRAPTTPARLCQSEADIPYLLRHCAEKLLNQYHITCAHPLLQDFVNDTDYAEFYKEHPALDEILYFHEPNTDTLGLLYQSLCGKNVRRHTGSFYTPASVADRLVSGHLSFLSEEQTFFDPACGTGIFFLSLPKDIPLKHLFGNDLNPLCIAVTRVNLALKYGISSEDELELLFRNFTVSDFLSETDAKKATPPHRTYDIILGNPPWGADLTEEQKYSYAKQFQCAKQTNIEIFDLFVEQALSLLPDYGTLSFILPEALFTVMCHASARQLLLSCTTALSVEYLGNVFENVYCPSVIITVRKDTSVPFYNHTRVLRDRCSYFIHTERALTEEQFSFSLTDEEYLLLEQLKATPHCVTLQGRADFALGIVTGNNARFLSESYTEGSEPLIRGNDISKYRIHRHSGYLRFTPEQFQQTAPEQFYRAKEKLFYRFINRQLIFAYDDTGLLSLNSCNIVIPHIDGISVKYVMAILNSSVAQFVFEKQFASVKVLRSHLEAIPIPLADKDAEQRVVAMVETLLHCESDSETFRQTYQELDSFIATSLYGLNEADYLLLAQGM